MNKCTLYVVTILFLSGCGGYPLKRTDPSGLHIAARENITSIVDDKIKGGVSVDATYITSTGNHYTGTVGITPLMEAASYGSLDVAKLLVKAGANLYAEQYPNTSLEGARLRRRKNAFDLAVEYGHLNMVEYLWQVSDKNTFKRNADSNLYTALILHCKKFVEGQHLEIFLYLFKNVANKEQIDWVFNRDNLSECAKDVKSNVYSGIPIS